MKKIVVLLLALVLVLGGCSSVGDAVNGIVNAVDPKMPEDEMYRKLSSLIGYTDGLKNTDLTGEFTFVAMIYSEGEEVTFKDEDYTGYYYTAGISRNWNDDFLLDTVGIDIELEVGDIVKVTGRTDGTIYWTEDNKRIDMLAIKASAVEIYEPEEIEEVVEPVATLKNGNAIEFVGAHMTEDSFGEAIVVYFKFINNSDQEAAPSLSDFYIEYNGEKASSTIFSLDEVDASALSMGPGITPKTYAGKSQLYYIAYSGDASAAEDEPIYFSLYDDEFRRSYDWGMEIAPSLDALKG